MDALIEKHRGKYDYDCVIPLSDEKDGTWANYLVKEYGLKPLVVRFDHGFMRPNLEENVKRVSRELEVDILTFTPIGILSGVSCFSRSLKRAIFVGTAIRVSSPIRCGLHLKKLRLFFEVNLLPNTQHISRMTSLNW